MKITVTPKNAPTEKDFYLRITEGLGIGSSINNLDALYDVLTEPREKFEIYIKDADFASRYDGRGRLILEVMKDAREEGGDFNLKIRTRRLKIFG